MMFKLSSVITLLFYLFSYSSFSQNIEPPVISEESGFYMEEFQVHITSENPDQVILYTTDGSEPKIDHLTGKEWNYKKHYPLEPNSPEGMLHTAYMYTFEYDEPIQIYDRTPESTILSTINTTILSNDIYAEGPLYKAFVLRARVWDENTEEYSETITRNYFISELGSQRYSLPVVAISIDNDVFYGYENGISVPGKLFDDWRAEHPEAPASYGDANYLLKGSETEFQINFNYFENGLEILNHDGGLRMNGGFTRRYPNKSLRLYAKNDYGEKNYKHEFFENYPINKFKRLILRNAGNDAVGLLFRDAFIHDLTRNLNYDIQESNPVIVFINGEYNGVKNMRERYDKKYFKSIHNVEEENLDFLENHVEVKEGDAVFYQEMINYFKNNSLSEDENYEQAITYMDPINYTDFFITNIYFANDDWPQNNYLFWRERKEYTPGDSTVNDGRFRWILKDVDRGFYLNDYNVNGYGMNTLAWATRILDENQNEFTGAANIPTLLIRRLLENENYQSYFINRFADVMNTTLDANHIEDFINAYQAVYQPEIEENYRRWYDFPSSLTKWMTYIDQIKDFNQNRRFYQQNHLIEMFNLDGIFDLTLEVSDEEEGYIHLNTIDILPETDGIADIAYPWNGQYFRNHPIKLEAVAKEGFKFSHWSGDFESTDSEIVIDFDQNSTLKANFEIDPMSVDQPHALAQVKLYPNPADEELMVQLIDENQVVEFKIFDLNGKEVQFGKLQNDQKINIHSLNSGVYFISLKQDEEILVKKFIKN